MSTNLITTNFITVFVDAAPWETREHAAISQAKARSNNPRGSWTVVHDPGDVAIVRHDYNRRLHNPNHFDM